VSFSYQCQRKRLMNSIQRLLPHLAANTRVELKWPGPIQTELFLFLVHMPANGHAEGSRKGALHCQRDRWDPKATQTSMSIKIPFLSAIKG
jgi:hypothetical protein